MVTEKDLQQFDMSLEELFEHILECKDAGLDTEARFLFKMFSERQQKTFLEYAGDLCFSTGEGDSSEIINFKNYFNHV